MSVILLPNRKQPQYIAPFAAGHNPSACVIGSVPVDLVRKQSRSESDLLNSARSCGRVRVAVDRYTSDTYPVSVPALADFTVYLYASYIDALDAFQYILGFSQSDNYLAIPATHANIGGHWGLFIGIGASATFIDSTETLPQNQLTAIVITRTGSTVKLFRDGVLKNTVTNSTTIPATTSLSLNSFGPNGDFGAHAGTYYALAGVEPVAWADGEVRRFSANPWQIFKAGVRRLYPVSSGGATHDLSANAQAEASASGALAAQIKFAATAQSQAVAAGSLTTQISLAADAVSVATADGVLTAHIQLSGTALAQAISTAALSSGINLSAAAVATASASGDLGTGTSGALEAHAIASVTASAELTTQILLGGVAVAQPSASADLTSGINLAGNAQAVAVADAVLSVSIQLTAAAIAQAIATGSLTAQIQLSASAITQALATATLDAQVELSSDPRYVARGRKRNGVSAANRRGYTVGITIH